MITILLQAVSSYLLTCLLTSCVLTVFHFKLNIVHAPKYNVRYQNSYTVGPCVKIRLKAWI